MKLTSFADELTGLLSGQAAMAKLATRISPLQFAAIGGASGLAGLGVHKLKHLITKDPYDEPIDSKMGATVKGVLGGLGLAGTLALLNNIAKKGY